MHKKIASRKKDRPIPIQNAIGIIIANSVGIICTVLMSLICSCILMKSTTLTNAVKIYFIACVVLGAFINGFIASKKCTTKGIISGLASSITFCLIIIIIMLFFAKGQLAFSTLFLCLGMVICSAIGGIFGANTKRRK